MALFRLLNIVVDVDSCKKWLWDKELLIRPGSKCSHCRQSKLTEVRRARDRTDPSDDGGKLRCSSCRKECSIRAHSFFAGSQLGLPALVGLLFLFAYRAPIGFVESMLDGAVSSRTALEWFSVFRQVCSRWLLANPMRLGGPGCIVEVDDCLIKRGKRKSDGERASGQWVFGAWDRRLAKGMIWTVDDSRSSDSLLPIIKEHVLPGSIIYSNGSPAYESLPDEGYHHDSVGRGCGFVTSNDYGVDVHLNSIKGWWSKLKTDLRKMRRVGVNSLPQHLDEVMYRQHRGDGDMVDYLCEDIAKFYPLPTQIP